MPPARCPRNHEQLKLSTEDYEFGISRLQPGTRELPVTHDRNCRDLQNGCDFVHCQTSKEAQLDNLTLRSSSSDKTLHRFVQRDNLFGSVMTSDY